MSQRLFSVAKVGLFLDAYKPSVEKRRDEEVTVVKLTLRLQPFDAKLATAIDDGLGGDSGVRANLFKLNHPDPKPHLERVDLSLGCPRQTLHIYAAPDAPDARIAFGQVKISGTYARTQKDCDGFAFVFTASYGPVGRDELEFIHAWYRTQRFVTFEASEPALWDDEDGDEDDDDRPSRSAPMWDEGAAPSTDTLQTLSFALLGKQCFLDVAQLAALTDAEREGLAKWAASKKSGPVWPPVLGRSHVAAAPPADGRQVCRKCGLVLHGDRDPVDPPFVEGSIIGLDCAGVDLENARPIAKRGSKKTKKVDHDALRDDQAADGRTRDVAH